MYQTIMTDIDESDTRMQRAVALDTYLCQVLMALDDEKVDIAVSIIDSMRRVILCRIEKE